MQMFPLDRTLESPLSDEEEEEEEEEEPAPEEVAAREAVTAPTSSDFTEVELEPVASTSKEADQP